WRGGKYRPSLRVGGFCPGERDEIVRACRNQSGWRGGRRVGGVVVVSEERGLRARELEPIQHAIRAGEQDVELAVIVEVRPRDGAGIIGRQIHREICERTLARSTSVAINTRERAGSWRNAE